MKKSVLNMLCMGALFLFASCSKQSETPEPPVIPETPETPETPEKPDIPKIKEVRVSICDFGYEPENASRTSYIVGESGYETQWADGDKLGIYPEDGSQLALSIPNGVEGNVAVLDGNKWPLEATTGYVAYYPFSKENNTVSKKIIPVAYADQVQNGNGETTHLSSFDYLASKPGKPTSDNLVILDMNHVGCIFLLKLTLPKAGTYTQVTLTSDNEEFTVLGTLDLTKEVPSITPTSTSNSITIDLKEVILASDNELLTVNLMVAPKDLSNSAISVTVTDNNGDVYTLADDQSIAGKKYVADKAYVFERTMLAPVPEPEEENSTGAELEPGGGIEEG